ncbi:MAG TPA: tRNA (adenosine(37)-N6)-threonylcarbamoyltransferase complex ATPase subunit type 1 TsaE [Chitinophagaceae bacterium]|nr:tRNA (adenosine(37)-N6)-threonylcarbamoyltransferase complex ATPase subunit type 1 TsaE [Chitinophagaceae bacterium]
MEWIISPDNINRVAKEFWKEINNNTVIAFHGPMGSGKTTFIHALCDVKAVKDVVGSPTFSIINEYEYVPISIGSEGTKKVLFHIDLYRLKDEQEAMKAGVEDVLYSGHICLVEWPEKAPGLFPGNTVHVFIEWVDDKTRRLKIANI